MRGGFVFTEHRRLTTDSCPPPGTTKRQLGEGVFCRCVLSPLCGLGCVEAAVGSEAAFEKSGSLGSAVAVTLVERAGEKFKPTFQTFCTGTGGQII